MRAFRGAVAVGVAACLSMGVAACGDDDESPAAGGSSNAEENGAEDVSGKVLGVSMHFLADDYSKDFADAVKAAGEEAGVTVNVASADSDPEKQLSDIQSFVTRQVDALIVIPIDEAAIVPAVKAAATAEIPVLSASQIPDVNDDLTAVVGPSDFENGKAACQEMVDEIGTSGSEVAISTASVKLFRIEERVRGCKEALDAGGLNVVETARGLSPEEGLRNAQNLISAHPEVRGIFGSFSNLVLGAGNAVKQAGRDDIAVSGVDADRTIIKQIAAGTVTAVAAQFPTQQADLITKAAIEVLGGGEVAHDQEDQLPTRTVNSTNYEDRYQEVWGEAYPVG